MKVNFIRLKYYLLIIWLSAKKIPKLNLGDTIIYNGEEYVLLQGVRNPYWSFGNGKQYIKNIHSSQFKKVYNIKSCINTFKHRHRFYMNNWYGIWCRNGIEDWMKRCNIW